MPFSSQLAAFEWCKSSTITLSPASRVRLIARHIYRSRRIEQPNTRVFTLVGIHHRQTAEEHAARDYVAGCSFCYESARGSRQNVLVSSQVARILLSQSSSFTLFPVIRFLPSLFGPRGIFAAPPPSNSLDPTMDVINRGSTAVVKRYRSNIVIKCPDRPAEHDNIDYHEIEKQILDILGPHPRIINFIGSSQEPVGLLFTEANCGDLQRYLDCYNELISDNLRLKWSLQAAEAIAYLHSKEVIHSDLRPENCLLHIYNDDNDPDLLLSDFGGSYCKTSDRVIDGNHLPDTGFFNPTKAWISTKDTDIFALGSVFYTIMTGHWPYKSPGPFGSVEEQEQYDEKVIELFMKREFPPVEGLVGGDMIHECWTEKIKDARAIVSRHEMLIRKREQSRRGRVELDQVSHPNQ